MIPKKHMTNREWVLDTLSHMSDRELSSALSVVIKQLTCDGSCLRILPAPDPERCHACFPEWLSETYSDPIPELRPGRFVRTRQGVGVITYTNGRFFVAYKDGCSLLLENEILEVYDASSFSECHHRNLIWKRLGKDRGIKINDRI